MSRTITISLSVKFDEAYHFLSNPMNLPKWVVFFEEVKSTGETWSVQTPFGQAKLRFVSKNNLGVLDHWVETLDGQVFYNPMRILRKDAETTDVLFTLFDEDADVKKDLARLKVLLEAKK